MVPSDDNINVDSELFYLARAKTHAISQPNWSQTVKPTRISRRHVTRTRPMEVLCLGRERTGTLSLRAALLYLGYYDVYHMSSALVENPNDCGIWCEALDAKRKGDAVGKAEWDALLGDCMAVTDQPAALFAEELMDAYPEAKVILTVRESPAAWHASVSSTILALVQLCSPRHLRHPGQNPLNHLQGFFAPRMPGPRKHEFFDKMVEALEGDRLGDEREGIEVYLVHNERVRRLAEAKGMELLEFNVKHGWEPLCEFLGKEVPKADDGAVLPFPRVNDSVEYKEMVRKLRWIVPLGYVINVVKVFGVPALAVGVWWWLYGANSVVR